MRWQHVALGILATALLGIDFVVLKVALIDLAVFCDLGTLALNLSGLHRSSLCTSRTRSRWTVRLAGSLLIFAGFAIILLPWDKVWRTAPGST